MVVSQHKTTAYIPKKTDIVAIETNNLKFTMDNKKKKRRNSIKYFELKENLNKQMTKENDNQVGRLKSSAKHKRNISEVRAEKKEDVNEETDHHEYDDGVLQATIDFDEQFWSCEKSVNVIINDGNDNDKTSVNNTGICDNGTRSLHCDCFADHEQASNKPNLTNGHTNGAAKCCEFSGIQNEDLSITLQIYCENHNESFQELQPVQKDCKSELILSTKQKDSEESPSLAAESVQIISEWPTETSRKDLGELESLVNGIEESQLNLSSLSLYTNEEADNHPDTPLAVANNCVCFCTEPDNVDQQMLSILENGFLFNHNIQSQLKDPDIDNIEKAKDGLIDAEKILDANDLPNYSHSCIYEERIIDFENFRIIEQVIDNNCEGKHTPAHKGKCSNFKECKTETVKHSENDIILLKNSHMEMPCGSAHTKEPIPIYVDPSLNFSCSDLVAFIGESYQVIDNARALYTNDETKSPQKSMPNKTKISSSVDNSPNKRGKRTYYATGSSAMLNRSVDDNNNNTRRYTGMTAAERLMQSLNCDVAKDVSQAKRAAKREVKLKTKPVVVANNKNTNTTNKILLKALQSKLTPLAPPFQPATIKTKAANNEVKVPLHPMNDFKNSTVLNYEQTTIYYQQQQQQHQQQQEQQIVKSNIMNNHQQLLQQFQLQQQQVTPSQHPQQTQQQQQQHLYLAQQQPNHLQLSPFQNNIFQNLPQMHHHHQQHQCAQNILAISAGSISGQAAPHLHLPTATLAAATTNNSNLSTAPTTGATLINMASTNPGSQQHHHLFPIHLIPAAIGTAAPTWPFIEASNPGNNNATTAPIFIDINGELRSMCPTHGPPQTAAVTITAQPLPAVANQMAASSNAAIMQQQNPVCLNPLQYHGLNVTAPYHAASQHQQHQQHQQKQQQQMSTHHLQQPLLHHHLSQNHSHQQPTLANSQMSPLRLKSTTATNSTDCAATNAPITVSTSNSPFSSSLTTASSTSASASPRVVIQLDAGISLPLQIAGKRKIFRGECTFYYNSL